jgi:hypothetical protein
MCGRFTLTERSGRLVEARFALADGHSPTMSLAITSRRPSPTSFVVTRFENHAIVPARSGLVTYWAKDASGASQAINANSETVESARILAKRCGNGAASYLPTNFANGRGRALRANRCGFVGATASCCSRAFTSSGSRPATLLRPPSLS